VVIDCANGAAYKVAPAALYELGAEVVPLGVHPDGFNINEECGSTDPHLMASKVREYRADLGIALDGDADRVIIADEHGTIVDGDQIIGLIAKAWRADGRLAKPGVVTTVMSNLALERFLKGQKLKLERTPVGDRYVSAKMREGGYNLGGEQSGHIVLSDFAPTGDGLIAALQVLAAMVGEGKKASELLNLFTPYPQILENVRLVNGVSAESPKVKSAITAAETRLGESGRVLVRKSGTEPVLRVMAEGEDEAAVRAAVREIVEAVQAA
jgi:phosphoglucosamine mutase